MDGVIQLIINGAMLSYTLIKSERWIAKSLCSLLLRLSYLTKIYFKWKNKKVMIGGGRNDRECNSSYIITYFNFYRC